MKLLNNFIGIICIFFSLASCEKEDVWSVSVTRVVINSTSKTLFYNVHTDEGIREKMLQTNDSLIFEFYKEKTVKTSWITNTVRQDGIQTLGENLYNLTDTSRYEYELDYEYVPQEGVSKEEQVYASHIEYSFGEQSTERDVRAIINLSITDSLLEIMEKDYTMLEKFSDYYE